MFTLEILSGLWIADSNILNSKKFMNDNQISIILNCTQIFDFPDIPNIQKIRLPFSNNKNSDTDLSLIRENKTKILDGAFIGSNTALVAPIKIGKNSVVGAGSTLTKNVKNKSLSLTRSKQVEIKNYKGK